MIFYIVKNTLFGIYSFLILIAYELEFGKFQQYLKNTDQCHLYEDNKSVIAMANNGRSYSDKTSHIKIHHYFVKQYLDNGEFTLNY